MERIERIARLYPQLMGGMSRLRTLVHDGVDLTYNQYKTLLTVANQGQCTLRELGEELDVAMSSASQMVDRLVVQGLLRREQDSENRRQVHIGLTPEGESLIAELQATILGGYQRLLSDLSDDEQEDLVRSFETIARLLKKVTEKEIEG